MYIYLIENKTNGFWYVGKRVVPSSSNDFKKYYGSGTRIKNAIKKFGKESFNKTLLEECNDKEHLAKRELFWLKKFISERGLKKCYNILLDCNYVGRKKGFHQTEEHVEKRINSAKKSGIYKWSSQRRKKYSEYRKTLTIWNKGKKSKNLSLSKTGSLNPNARKVIDKETGKIFDTIKDAAEHLGIKHITLWQYISGKRKNKTKMEFYK